jgi:chemotaxis signal transduction protein
MTAGASPQIEWLRFRVGDSALGLPLNAVGEVATNQRPSLIPLVPLEVGGVLNLRGEPLPVVDGGALMGSGSSVHRRHAIVLEEGKLRLGVLVDSVSRIERGLEEAVVEELDSDDPEAIHPDFVRWVRSGGGRVGLIDAEILLKRATDLLSMQVVQKGEDVCLNAF